MAVPKPSLTGGVKRVPWIALICALVAIGYCAGLWFGGMSTFETLKVCMPSTDIEACIGAAESKVVLPDISLVIDLVGLLFGVIALWIACSGLNTWKSELKHRRNLDLFDFITSKMGKVSSEIGFLKNNVLHVREHFANGSLDAHTHISTSGISMNNALSAIIIRIQDAASVDNELLSTARETHKQFSHLSTYLMGLSFRPAIPVDDMEGWKKFESESQDLILKADFQLKLFKDFCRHRLTAG